MWEDKDFKYMQKKWDKPNKGFIARIDAGMVGKVLVKIAEILGKRKRRKRNK
jgi:hypothetical protein